MFLVTINRNISADEFKIILLNLKREKIDHQVDPWNYSNIIFPKKPEFFNGTSQVIELYNEFEFTNITEIVDKISKYKIKQINAKIKKDLKFHKQAIEDRFLRKNSFDEKGIILYLEAKNRGKKIYCRIGKIVSETQEKKPNILKQKPNDIKSNNNKPKEIALLLENTSNSNEVADFLRLGVALNCKIYFKTNKDMAKEIKDAQKLFKSNKIKYTIISNLNEIKDYYLIGFSLWGKENEKSLQNIEAHKIMLLFGNENRGLLKETMDACKKTVYLGPKSSEPLRANQAAAYAYGILNNK